LLKSGSVQAGGLFVLISYGLMIIATLLLREIEGAVLRPDGGEAYDTAMPQNTPPPRGSP
jgi:hypothetical protein